MITWWNVHLGIQEVVCHGNTPYYAISGNHDDGVDNIANLGDDAPPMME